MSRLDNPLVHDLLEIAGGLAQQSGGTSLREAAARRAVSTSYYAAFHALCFVCADELVGWSRDDDLGPIYRSVEHNFARKQLASRQAAMIGAEILAIGAAFTDLQKRRHAADYMPPGLRIDAGSTRDALTLARQIIHAIEALGETQRRRLAILLIARPRAD